MIFGRTVKGKRDYYGNQYTFNGTDRRTVSYDRRIGKFFPSDILMGIRLMCPYG